MRGLEYFCNSADGKITSPRKHNKSFMKYLEVGLGETFQKEELAIYKVLLRQDCSEHITKTVNSVVSWDK